MLMPSYFVFDSNLDVRSTALLNRSPSTISTNNKALSSFSLTCVIPAVTSELICKQHAHLPPSTTRGDEGHTAPLQAYTYRHHAMHPPPHFSASVPASRLKPPMAPDPYPPSRPLAHPAINLKRWQQLLRHVCDQLTIRIRAYLFTSTTAACADKVTCTDTFLRPTDFNLYICYPNARLPSPHAHALADLYPTFPIQPQSTYNPVSSSPHTHFVKTFLSDSTTVVQRSSPTSKLASPDPSIRHDPRPRTSACAPQLVCYLHSSSPLPGPIHCTPTTNSPSYIHKSTVFLFVASNAST
ncbi:hypothetical protein BDN70DRAFT_937818 [Pholiota conissans]|uniref:Uncharacterized protein n=1 Tax=Pholiota conissans TaxID=109636 RepID=A0A9P5YS36_9AGAR|nr:hypothetical protein BDN70DRAFT_937818 [Pholiota conissans]